MFIRPFYLLVVALLFLFPRFMFGQEELANVRFGEVSAADFDMSKYTFDTTANAVIIADIGSAIMDDVDGNRFTFWHKGYRRILILNEEGKKLANESIKLFGRSKVSHFKGISYTLKDGKVVKSVMDENDYHFDNQNEYTDVIKFTVPNVQVGSIIELDYLYSSGGISYLPSRQFQGKYPVLWSSFEFQHYSTLNYYVIPQTIIPFHEVDQKNKEAKSLTAKQWVGSNIWRYWSMKNIPAIKKEPLVYNVKNYQSRLDFELSYLGAYGVERVHHQKDWETFSNYLLEDLEWFKPYYKRHNFFKSMVPAVNGESKLALAKRVYYHIRDKYTTDKTNSIKPKRLPYVIKDKKIGTPTELNLYLVSALRSLGIKASPLLLNRRGNGKPIANIPILRRLTNVVCHAKIKGQDYLLDVSSPDLQFDRLNLSCYNGIAHIVDRKTSALNLSADSIKETKQTTVQFSLKEETDEWEFVEEVNFGFYASQGLKKLLREKGQEAVKKQLIKNGLSEVKLKSFEIKNNTQDTFCVVLKQKCGMFANQGIDKIYANITTEKFQYQNAFKAKTRSLPIEFPFVRYEVKSTELIIPKGYQVDDMPKNAQIELEGGKGSYAYLIEKTEDKVIVNTILRLNKAIFQPAEFAELKQFFNYIEALQQETIVLSKM